MNSKARMMWGQLLSQDGTSVYLLPRAQGQGLPGLIGGCLLMRILKL